MNAFIWFWVIGLSLAAGCGAAKNHHDDAHGPAAQGDDTRKMAEHADRQAQREARQYAATAEGIDTEGDDASVLAKHPAITAGLLQWPAMSPQQMAQGVDVPVAARAKLKNHMIAATRQSDASMTTEGVAELSGCRGHTFTIDHAPDVIFKTSLSKSKCKEKVSTKQRYDASRHLATACADLQLSGLRVPHAKLLEVVVDDDRYAVIAEQAYAFDNARGHQRELFWQGGPHTDDLILQLAELIAATGLTDIAPRNVVLASDHDREGNTVGQNHQVLVLLDTEEYEDKGQGLTGSGLRPPGLLGMVKPQLAHRIVERAEQIGLVLDKELVQLRIQQQQRYLNQRQDLWAWQQQRGLHQDWGRRVDVNVDLLDLTVGIPPHHRLFQQHLQARRSLAKSLVAGINASISQQLPGAFNTFTARNVELSWNDEFHDDSASVTAEQAYRYCLDQKCWKVDGSFYDDIDMVCQALERAGIVFATFRPHPSVLQIWN